MEERRIFTEKKMILTVMLLFLFAIGGYVFQQYKDAWIFGYSYTEVGGYVKKITGSLKNDTIEQAQYKLEKKIEKKKEKIEENQYKNKEEKVAKLLFQERILKEEKENLVHIAGYASYVENTQTASERLNRISIFQNKDTFSQKNIEKTKQDYEGLLDVQVKYGNYKAVTSLFQYKELSYILFVFVCIILWYFFEDERIGQKVIFYATKEGRLGLFLWRVRALVGAVAIFTFFVYFSIFILAIGIYGGWSDLEKPIQSIYLFKDFVHTVSIAEYLGIYLVLRIYTMLVLAFVIWMGMLVFRNRKVSLMLLFLVFFMQGNLWSALEEQSPYLYLKCWNIYNILHLEQWTVSYRNLQVGNLIVNSFSSFLCYTLLIGVFAFCFSGAISIKRRPVKEKSRLEKLIGMFGKKVSVGYHRILSKFSVFWIECYKVIVLEKGWMALAIWGILLLSMLDLTKVSYYGSGAKMQEIYVEYSGNDKEKISNYVKQQTKSLKKEKKKYRNITLQYEEGKISEKAMMKAERENERCEILSDCVSIIKEKLQYINRQKRKYGREVYFLNEKPYKILFINNNTYEGKSMGSKSLKAMFILILLVFLSNGLFSYDVQSGAEKMLHTTQYGRGRLFWKKVWIMIGISMLLCLGTYCLELYEVHKVYSFTCLDAPVQSLEFLEVFPIEMDIKTFLIFVGAIQLLSCITVGFMICMFSIYAKGRKGLLLNGIIILIPAAGYILGIEELKYISVIQPLMYVKMLMEQGILGSTIFIILQIGIGGIMGYFGMKKYCNS